MELSPFGMLMWHVYERTLKNQRFLSLQNQINYRQNQLRSPPRRVQLAGEWERQWEGPGSSETRLTALLRHEVDTKASWRLLTAVSCSNTRNASITRLVSTLTFSSFACGDQDEVHTAGEVWGGREVASPDSGRKSPKRACPKCPHCSPCVLFLLFFSCCCN